MDAAKGSPSLGEFVAAARGAAPADLVLRNARVVNVLTGEVHAGTVGVKGDRVLGLGDYRTERGEDTIDLAGAYVAPALWDAHLHIESTMTTPGTFGALAATHGTAAVVTDPHEIANVRGVPGIRDFAAAAAPLPVDVFVMLPSCVPSTHLETAGASLSASDLAPLYRLPKVLGLAELMNVPGFLFGDPAVVAKVEDARRRRVPVDGHAPLLTGLDLNAYVGAGIRSDHECLSRSEAHEKVRLGMDIWIREGTAAKNLDDLLPLVTAANSERFAFATDDRHPWDLLVHGHLDHHVRRAIARGLDPVLALRLASWSCARHYGFLDRGAVAPGFRADLLTFENLDDFRPDLVVLGGTRVAKGGRLLADVPAVRMEEGPGFRVEGFDRTRLAIAAGTAARVRVIEARAGSLATGASTERARVEAGVAVPDLSRDLLKLAVVERHRGTGNVGVAFARGFGLKRGAIASSVAHDSHNVVVVGADDASMETAVRRVAAIGGGIVVADGAQALAEVALPVGGLMSNSPMADVDAAERRANAAAAALGGTMDHPFMTLAFLALPVIPELKLTDRGLVDVRKFDFVSPVA
ncbi:MAG TPA: adenine deaminase [Thermoanaerobaculia bacterium]|nr:adenine deaminase [Thermoanaerobaculia bacterium]